MKEDTNDSITPLEFFATKHGQFHRVRLLTKAMPKRGYGTFNPVFEWKLKTKEEILAKLEEIGWEEKWCSNWKSFERWRDDNDICARVSNDIAR